MSAAVESLSMPTLWLRRPEAVQQHLEFAASEIRVCVVSVGGQQVRGELTSPDTVSGQFDFQVHSSLKGVAIPPHAGMPARVDYEGKTDRFAFFTEVVEVTSPMRWRLAQPLTVERQDKRLSRRICVLGEPGFSLHLHVDGVLVRFELLDLSAGGLALTFDQEKTPLKVGEILRGVLRLPGPVTFKIELTLRHTRQNGLHHVAGARFEQITYDDRMTIRRLIAARAGAPSCPR